MTELYTILTTTKAGLYGIGILGLLGAILSAYFRGKSKGKNEAFRATAEATTKLVERAAKKREDIREEWSKIREEVDHLANDSFNNPSE